MLVNGEMKTIILDEEVMVRDKASTFALTIRPDNDGKDFHVICKCVFNSDEGVADISFAARPTITFTGINGDEYKIILNRNTSEYVQGRYLFNKVGTDFARAEYSDKEIITLQLTREKLLVNVDMHNAPKENVIAVAVTACMLMATVYECPTSNMHLRSLFGCVRERIRRIKLGGTK